MNLIDDVRDIVEFITEEFGNHLQREFVDVIERLVDAVAAFDALAPDWSQAPDWALWYAIDSGGMRVWYETEPTCYISVWDVYEGARSEIAVREPLPPHIDWRDCKFRRPEPSP